MSPVKVNLGAARRRLGELAERAAAGEEIVLCRRGQPLVRLQPIRARRKIGSAAGQFRVPDDFLRPLSEDELAEFYR